MYVLLVLDPCVCNPLSACLTLVLGKVCLSLWQMLMIKSCFRKTGISFSFFVCNGFPEIGKFCDHCISCADLLLKPSVQDPLLFLTDQLVQ